MGKLERQVERGSLFTHTALGRNSLRLAEVESFTYGLLDVFLAKGLITAEEVTAAVENIRQESANRGDVPEPGVALRMEEQPEEQPTVKVDCGARMHVCHAVCCKLEFALTVSEVEAGKVKWDLGRPYFIRHDTNGFCTHNDRNTGGCGVYNDRPTVCRTYSCAEDTRIWKDFARVELNTEWLAENLSAVYPRFVTALMQSGHTRQSLEDVTPSELELIESGVSGVRAVLTLLDDPKVATRKHAQRVLEGVVMRRHSWVREQGYQDPTGEEQTRALLAANGNYQANAPLEERRESIEKWRQWLEMQEQNTEKNKKQNVAAC
ncbi:MAG TPA: YkgJ family cysteine cluster protein [Chloroflexia bacterium]